MITQKSTQAKPAKLPAANWFVVDAKDQVLGRLATVLARVITGRHKVDFTPGVDMGDYVVVLNAEQIALTRTKMDTKLYRHHSGYTSGLKTFTARQLLERSPERLLKRAVWGMTNKSSMNRRQVAGKLKVYSGTAHPHAGQNPQALPANVLRKTNVKK